MINDRLMTDFESPLNIGFKTKYTSMSVIMPILVLYLCIFCNFLREKAEKNENYLFINFGKQFFHYLQQNFLQRGKFLINH